MISKTRLLPLLLFLFCVPLFAQLEINSVRFVHQTTFSKADFEEVIHSEEGEDFEPRLLKTDRILLVNFLRKKGYLDAQVSDSVSYQERRTKANIFFLIDAGIRYFYGGLRLKGVQEVDSSKIYSAFENLRVGRPLDEALVLEARNKVENIYYNSGKPFVNIRTEYIFADSLAIVELNITENMTVYIKDVEYRGTDLVQKFLIRRELEIKPGEMYNRQAIEYSQQNLYGTGLFRFVRMEIEPISGEPGQVVLRVYVQEKEARWIGVSFGLAHERNYSSGAEVTLQGGHRNIFGTARSASLHLTPSFLYEFDENKVVNNENKIEFKFVEPWIGNTRTPGIFQVSYHQYRPPKSGDYNLVRGSFEVLHRFREQDIELNASISAKYLERVDDQDIDLGNLSDFDAGQSRIYSISTYGKRDTRPNLFNPFNGSLTDFGVTFSLSSGENAEQQTQTNQFFTIVSSWSRYQPWRPTIFGERLNWILASRIKGGAILETGGSKTVPISERFYAGGATTVRGFREQLLGPAARLNDQGEIESAAGGKFITLANIEARVPLFWLFWAEVFVDAGQVWAEVADVDPADIRATAGAGLAIITPIGPVRIDYGHKLQKRSTDPAPDAWHLGVYFAF